MELTKEYNFIWYGQCGTIENDLPDCEEYILPANGKIEQVWQINDAGDAKVWDKAAQPETPFGDGEFVKLECGHAYYIRLSQEYAPDSGVDIPHAYVSDFANNSHVHDNPLLLGTCEEGSQGPQTQLTSIALGNCSVGTINLTANVNDPTNYATCVLTADAGATFRTIEPTTSNNVTYELNGSTFSYKIDDTANANVGGELTVTITADATTGYEFANQTTEDTLEVKLQATVNALAPVINNFAGGQVQILLAAAVPNNAVQFNPVPLVANAPAGAQLKFNVVGPDGVKVVDNVVEPIDQVAAFGDQFLHAGEYTVTAEIVDDSEASLAPQVITDAYTFTIDRSIASISVEDIDHGNIDRDNLPDTKTSSVTALNISGDWSIDTNATNADITVTKQSNDLQSILDTDEIRAVDSNNVVTITQTGTKWNQVLGSDGGLTPASNEVTATCTITATVTDALVFAWDGATPSDPVRDDRETDDSIPNNPTAYKFKQDNVNVTATLTGNNWEVKIGDGGNWVTDVSALNGSTDGTSSNIRFRYNSSEVVTDATGTFTLSGVATNSESDPGNLVVNLKSTITQAIGAATFSGCSSIPAITLDVGDTSDSTNNNETCDLTTTDCSVADVTDTTLGIFTYNITSNVVNYWITNASSAQVTSTVSLDVTANADNNFLIDGQPTKIISITLSGTVNAVVVPASIAGCDNLTKITLDQGATSTAEIGSQTCTLTLTNATVAEATDFSGSGTFNYTIGSDGPAVNGVTTYTLTYWLDSTATADSNISDDATIQATLTTGTEWATGDGTLVLTFEAEVEAVLIPENSTIGLGTCPINITQAASTTATEQTCVLAQTNATFGVINETSLNGITYSLAADGTVTYKAETPNASPSTTVTYNHTFEATGTTDNAATSLFTGQSQTDTRQVSLQVTVEAVVVADDKLWAGFQDGSNVTYSTWYELDVVDSQAVIDLDINSKANAVNGWNSFYPGTDKIIEDGTKYNPTLHDDGGWNPFSSESGITGSLLGSYFDSYEDLKSALAIGNVSGDGTGAEFNIITGSRSTTIVVSFIAPLAYTSFQIASTDSAYTTELSTLMSQGGEDVGYLQGVMITASPDRPSGALDATQQGKTYNSDLLNVFCNGCPPESGGEGVLLKIVQVVGAGTDTKSYNATSCSHGGMTTGNWQNSKLYYAGSASASQGSVARQDPESSPIVINEMYFELASAATKLKLDSGKLPDCA